MRRLILVLALTALVWAQITVENVQCTMIWEGNVYTTQGVPISFSFGAVGPVMSTDSSGRFYAFFTDAPKVTVWGKPKLQCHGGVLEAGAVDTDAVRVHRHA
jgi:hypothetical protein